MTIGYDRLSIWTVLEGYWMGGEGGVGEENGKKLE